MKSTTTLPTRSIYHIKANFHLVALALIFLMAFFIALKADMFYCVQEGKVRLPPRCAENVAKWKPAFNSPYLINVSSLIIGYF